MISKFEDILAAFPRNYDRYTELRQLFSDACNKEEPTLIVYFGAGSSLYSTKWKEPFVKVCSALPEKIREIVSSIGFRIKRICYDIEDVQTRSDRGELSKEECEQRIKKLTEELDKLKGTQDEPGLLEITNALSEKTKKANDELSQDNPDCLKIGDDLDEVFRKLKPIAQSYGQDIYDSFDDACIAAMEDIKNNKLQEERFYSAYSFPHLYYVYYLARDCMGIRLITTNIDDCFRDICRELSPERHVPNIACKEEINLRPNDFYKPSFTVYHIHGNVVDKKTLVMTGKDYNSAYGEIQVQHGLPNGMIQLLVRIAGNETPMLFLGASMKSDAPVDVFVNYAPGGNTYIPFFHHDRVQGANDGALRPIYFYDFNDYSQMLHAVLREIDSEKQENLFKGCSWLTKGFADPVELPDKIKTQLDDLMLNNSPFLSYNLLNREEGIDWDSNEQGEAIAGYLFNRYHYSKKDYDNLSSGWSICIVYGDSFTLARDNSKPLHNLPLGNTVYIIGPSNELGSEMAEQISNEIRFWRENTYVELGCPLDMGDDILKVRIIRLPCLSELEREIIIDLESLISRSTSIEMAKTIRGLIQKYKEGKADKDSHSQYITKSTEDAFEYVNKIDEKQLKKDLQSGGKQI